MDEFLRASAVIDCDTLTVAAMAVQLAGGATTDEAVAKQCFDWVRDQVCHSTDHGISVVTCRASEVLEHRAGFCYAKSHLLVALLRANRIPAALCYQRLALNDEGTAFCLHGLVSVFLKDYGWYRIDPRGNKPGITADFCPPAECLAFAPRLPGETDIDGRYADPLLCVVAALQRWPTAGEVARNLPDYDPRHRE